MTLETSFMSDLTIFSYLDATYLYKKAIVSILVNASNILIYSNDFSGFLQPYLTGAKSAKGARIKDT